MCGKVNALLLENNATGKFVTFLYGILNCETRPFRYSNAGHLHSILITSGAIGMLEYADAVFGVFPA